MTTRDHTELSEFLMKQMGYPDDVRCRTAFRLGSIEPDYNMLTYLRGSIHQQTLRGHNYENARLCIQKLMERLQKEEISRVKKYYLLGKLIHYTADAFTYPHNRIFPGTLKEHCRYEEELHRHFQETLQSENVICTADPGKDLFQRIEELHQEYLEKREDLFSDCRYISNAVYMIFQYFTAERGSYEYRNFYRYLLSGNKRSGKFGVSAEKGTGEAGT